MYDHIEIIRNITNNQLIKPYFKVGFTIIQNFYRLTYVGYKFIAVKIGLLSHDNRIYADSL